MRTTRDLALDATKGVAIFLIVLGHVIRGLAAAGLVDSHSALYRHSDTGIYLVHLPVFVLLSALFVSQGVKRDGTRGYLTRRTTDLVWVFLVWTLLQGIVKIATSSLDNAPLQPQGLAQEFIRPTSQLWFLPFLIVTTIVMVIATPWKATRMIMVAPFVTLISLGTWGYQGTYIGTLGCGLAIFSLLGIALGYSRFRSLLHSRCALLVGIVSAGTFGAINIVTLPTAPTSGGPDRTWSTVTTGVIASAVGIVGLLCFGALLARTPAAHGMAFMGKHSMEIFLGHIICASGTRIVLGRLGVSSPTMHILCGLTAGIVGPLVLWWLSQYRLGWLFHTPRVITARVPGFPASR